LNALRLDGATNRLHAGVDGTANLLHHPRNIGTPITEESRRAGTAATALALAADGVHVIVAPVEPPDEVVPDFLRSVPEPLDKITALLLELFAQLWECGNRLVAQVSEPCCHQRQCEIEPVDEPLNKGCTFAEQDVDHDPDGCERLVAEISQPCLRCGPGDLKAVSEALNEFGPLGRDGVERDTVKQAGEQPLNESSGKVEPGLEGRLQERLDRRAERRPVDIDDREQEFRQQERTETNQRGKTLNPEFDCLAKLGADGVPE